MESPASDCLLGRGPCETGAATRRVKARLLFDVSVHEQRVVARDAVVQGGFDGAACWDIGLGPHADTVGHLGRQLHTLNDLFV